MKVKQNSLNYEKVEKRIKGSKEVTNLRIKLERGEEGLKRSSHSFKKKKKILKAQIVQNTIAYLET